MCVVCHGPSAGRFGACFCCQRVAAQLARPLAPVVPVSVAALPSPLHTVLRGYKDAPVAEARRRFGRLVGLLVEGFVVRHGPCVARQLGGPAQLVVPVPPTLRPGPPPLAASTHGCADVLVRGGATSGHLRASPDAFVVTPSGREAVRGRRVLVVDDSLITGARAQSAAAALRAGGAGAVTVLVVGRVVRPARSTTHAAYLRRARAAPYEPGRCCVAGCEGGPPTAAAVESGRS